MNTDTYYPATIIGVCVLYTAPSEGREPYRRDILNTILLTRITVHKQSLTMGNWGYKHHIQLLGNDAYEYQ